MIGAPRLARALSPWTDVWSRSGWTVQARGGSGEARLLSPEGAVGAHGSEADAVRAAERSAPPPDFRRAAVLLHGLGHHPGAMERAARALREDGWNVANFGYASLRGPAEAHGRAASSVARSLAEAGAERISFCGHSLGGLVARLAMARAGEDGWRPGRLLLVGSPARGSSAARAAARLKGYRALTGACGQTVTPAGAASVPDPACDDVGVVAGGTGGRGYNPFLRGDNDGVVTVDETRLPGRETSFLLVRSLHAPLASNRETVSAALRFLSCGRLAA